MAPTGKGPSAVPRDRQPRAESWAGRPRQLLLVVAFRAVDASAIRIFPFRYKQNPYGKKTALAWPVFLTGPRPMLEGGSLTLVFEIMLGAGLIVAVGGLLEGGTRRVFVAEVHVRFRHDEVVLGGVATAALMLF